MSSYNKMTDSQKLMLALEVACNAHDGQLYGTQPYIMHPIGVAKLIADAGYSVDFVVVGLLHDVVEDSSYKVDDISHLFGTRIGEAVECVTRFEGESYKDLLNKATMIPLSLVSKFYDVFYNHRVSGRNTRKYREAFEFLAEKIGYEGDYLTRDL